MSRNKPKTRVRQAAPVFAALGDDLRLQLVTRLSESAPLSITRLAHGLPVTRQAVTKHLHVLAEAGLIRCQRCGREQRWELDGGSVAEAQRFLEAISRQWASALGRLKTFVEESQERP